jgi:hypothetical protein
MMHLTEDDLYDEVEGIISAADFIEKPKAPNCCSSDRRHALHRPQQPGHSAGDYRRGGR